MSWLRNGKLDLVRRAESYFSEQSQSHGMFSIMEECFKPEATGFLCQAGQLGARVRRLKFGQSYKRHTTGRKKLTLFQGSKRAITIWFSIQQTFLPSPNVVPSPVTLTSCFLCPIFHRDIPHSPVCANTLTSRSPGNATFFSSPSQIPLLECVPHSHPVPNSWHPSIWTGSSWVPLLFLFLNCQQPQNRTRSCTEPRAPSQGGSEIAHLLRERMGEMQLCAPSSDKPRAGVSHVPQNISPRGQGKSYRSKEA